jgi:hypothetical protein
MKRDESLPSIRVEPANRLVHQIIGNPKPFGRPIRAWRSTDVEQQDLEWRKARARQIEESDVFWKLRMRNRP